MCVMTGMASCPTSSAESFTSSQTPPETMKIRGTRCHLVPRLPQESFTSSQTPPETMKIRGTRCHPCHYPHLLRTKECYSSSRGDGLIHGARFHCPLPLAHCPLTGRKRDVERTPCKTMRNVELAMGNVHVILTPLALTRRPGIKPSLRNEDDSRNSQRCG